jgi:phage baseplate assembly protein gpV
MDDQDGQEQCIVETPGGQKITLKDQPARIVVEDSSGNTITLESAGISITTAGKVSVSASNVSVSAGMVTVDAGIAKFSGVVKCDTLLANSVVSAVYTPGTGNIW